MNKTPPDQSALTGAITIALTMLIAASAPAVDIPVPNFSFEDPNLPDGTRIDISGVGSTTSIPGWTTKATLFGSSTAGFGTWNPQDNSFTGTTGPNPDGVFTAHAAGLQVAQIHLISVVGGVSSASVISDSLGLVEPNTKYSLSLAIGSPWDFGIPADVSWAFTVDGLIVAQRINSVGPPRIGGFARFTLDFITGGLEDVRVGGALAIELGQSSVDFGTGDSLIAFDNVTVTATPVPEPSTLFLLCVTLPCYGLARMRSRIHHI